MRKLLLLPLVLWACGTKEAPPADTAAMVPAALTAADVVGSYAGTTMVQGPDSVMTSTWTASIAANAAGGLDGKIVNAAAPADTTAFSMTLSADSTINVSAPYTDPMAAKGSPQMAWTSVGRATGNDWTGTVNWMVAGSDSVTQSGTWTGTRTP